MERLIELVPPYLSAEQRFAILKHVVKIHKRIITSKKLKSAYYVRSTKITKTKECVACEA